MARLFDQVEAGGGLSDLDAELFIRWLWKVDGLGWIFNHPDRVYLAAHTLRGRVLLPIGDIRKRLVLAISLLESVDSSYGDRPLGVDSDSAVSGVFVAGVFSMIAVMVVHERFQGLIPDAYSTYQLAPKREPTGDTRLFYPRIGFRTCTEAVQITAQAARTLSILHDRACAAGLES